MKETDLNRIIGKSFRQYGFAHKLVDPPKVVATSASKNPFDGFAVYDGSAIYWEGKLDKEYKAFSFGRLREHQIEALTEISKISSANIYPLVIWGIWEPRKTKRIFVFHIDAILQRMERGEKSFKKKEVMEFVKDGKYLDVEKELFDVKKLMEKIIWPTKSNVR